MVRILGFPDDIAETPQGIPPLDHPDRAARVAAWEAWRDAVMAYRVERKTLVAEEPALETFEQRYCADPETGIFYWLLLYGYIFEPREDADNADAPFILFPFQIDYLQWLDSLKYQRGAKRDGIVPKSRDMGASWVTVARLVWKWLFTYPAQFRVVSWRADEVDARNSDSLFWKMDYLLERQPSYLLPPGFEWDTARFDKTWQNPTNKNAIVGQASTERAMRGGRAEEIDYDEAAINKYFAESWESTSNVAPVRVALSSVHLDYNTLFQELAFPDNLPPEHQPSVFRMHYWLHPYHDQEWVEEQRARMAASPGKFEREILMDARAGSTTIVYPQVLDKVPDPDIAYIPGAPLWVGIDPGHSDSTAVVWMQESPDGHMHILNAYQKSKMTADFWGTLIKGTPYRRGKDWDDRFTGDEVGTGLGEDGEEWHYTPQEESLMEWVRGLPKPTAFYGDMSGKSTLGASKDTFYKRLAGFGIHVNRDRIESGQISAERMEARTYLGRQTATKEVLPRMRFADSWGARLCLNAMKNYRWPNDDRPRTTEARSPLHDEHSHLTTAVEYVCVNLRILRRVHSTKKRTKGVRKAVSGYLMQRADYLRG